MITPYPFRTLDGVLGLDRQRVYRSDAVLLTKPAAFSSLPGAQVPSLNNGVKIATFGVEDRGDGVDRDA